MSDRRRSSVAVAFVSTSSAESAMRNYVAENFTMLTLSFLRYGFVQWRRILLSRHGKSCTALSLLRKRLRRRRRLPSTPPYTETAIRSSVLLGEVLRAEDFASLRRLMQLSWLNARNQLCKYSEISLFISAGFL